MDQSTKNVILFVGYFVPPTQIIEEIHAYFGDGIEVAILYDKNRENTKIRECASLVDHVLAVDTTTQEPEDVIRKLGPRLISATVRGETYLDLYKRLLPVLNDFVYTPSPISIEICTSKAATRDVLEKSYPAITTRYERFNYSEDISVMCDRVIERLQFPVIIKPTGLSTSMLVVRANTPTELNDSLHDIQERIRQIYSVRSGRGEMSIVVEEFIEGQLYSVDAYVDKDGNSQFCPFVKTITGVKAGKSDYYGYFQVTPSGLSTQDVYAGEEVARQLIQAVGLRNSSAHIELIFSESGWKIVEIGPRLGGYRSQLYRLSYDIAHNINDILIHSAQDKISLGKQRSYAAMCKIYADNEGIIQSIGGIDEMKALDGVAVVKQNLQVGDEFLFARNGGVSIFEIIITGSDEQSLRRLLEIIEATLKINVAI